jgi:hypothetical protein
MRAFLFCLLTFFLFIPSAQAVLPIFAPQGACITASSIPTTYSLSSAQSNILALATNTSATHFAVTANTLGAQIAFSVSSATSQVAPGSTSANANQIFVDSNEVMALDGLKIANQILLRSNSGSAITSGYVCILVW